MMRRIDLLPATYAEKRAQRRNVAGVVAAGCVLLALLLVWWFMLGSQVSGAQSDLDAAEARNRNLQAQISELQRFADLQNEVQTKEQALGTIMAGDVAWPSLMTEIAMVIPGEVWLTNMSASAGTTEGAAPVASESAEIRISGKQPIGRISFTGRSLTMPGIGKWLLRLESSKAFSAAYLETATENEPTDETPVFIDFTSTLELNQKAFSHRYLDGDK